MADLSNIEKRHLEKILEMSGGYVLDFSNRTFEEFVIDSTGKNIWDEKYNYAVVRRPTDCVPFGAKSQITSSPNSLAISWSIPEVGRLLTANPNLHYLRPATVSFSD